MKIEMKNNVVTLTSTSKKEAQKMVEFFYGTKQKPEKIIERVIVQNGIGKGRYKRRPLPKVQCPKCGKTVKGLKQHDNLAHQGMPPGWSINANKKREVRELLPA